MTRPVVHLAPREGKSIRIGPYQFTFKAGGTTGSAHAIAEVTVPPGGGNFLHRHPSEETMYVLAGDFDFYGEDGERRRAGPGGAIHVPPNAGHGFVNVGATPGVLLVVAPTAQESLFDDLAAADADPARVAAACARHDLHDLSGERGSR